MPPATAPTTVTLADLAAHLGVSRTTVSNAYNRPNQLSPKLRERVLAAARDLGYGGPDPMARGLRRGQTGSLRPVFDAPPSYPFPPPPPTRSRTRPPRSSSRAWRPASRCTARRCR